MFSSIDSEDMANIIQKMLLTPHHPPYHEHQTERRCSGHHDHHHGMRHAAAAAALFVLNGQWFGIKPSGFRPVCGFRRAAARIRLRACMPGDALRQHGVDGAGEYLIAGSIVHAAASRRRRLISRRRPRASDASRSCCCCFTFSP